MENKTTKGHPSISMYVHYYLQLFFFFLTAAGLLAGFFFLSLFSLLSRFNKVTNTSSTPFDTLDV
jgi:hypothetical protein